MDDTQRIIDPHGGYRQLRSFQTARTVYDATVDFCERFIERNSRTRDQMIQAARSGVQNIAEGSMASATSKKTELKLTGVARASLEELLLDYEDFLRQRGLRLWRKDSPEAMEVRGRYKSDGSDRSPYSINWEGDSNPLLINDPRFSPAGVLAPKSKADLAFTMHMLSWLSTIGTAAIVEFPGVLYRGGAEQKIRKYLVDNNYIDTVIQLPPDLFFGTTIATCIIVLKKSKKDNKTLFIDASSEFVRGGNKNKLSDENRSRILKAFTKRADVEHFASLVDNKTIGENDYNIAVSSYVSQKDTREVIDIAKLNAEIAGIVARQNELRTAIDAIVADIEGGR